MKRKTSLFLFLFFVTGLSTSFALDPVAPKSERAFGFVSLESPLPTDVGELTGVAPAGLAPAILRPGDLFKVPVGEYNLKVKMQGYEWTSPISVTPTELTAVVVPGYGNLKVSTPNPSVDQVEVYSPDGSVLKSFRSSEIVTLPIGTYRVKVKLGPEALIKGQENLMRDVVRTDVKILPNETRRLVVYK